MFCTGLSTAHRGYVYTQFENFSIQIVWEFVNLKKNNTKNKFIVEKTFFEKMLFENPVPFNMHLLITT